jgi:hypothetical protein
MPHNCVDICVACVYFFSSKSSCMHHNSGFNIYIFYKYVIFLRLTIYIYTTNTTIILGVLF